MRRVLVLDFSGEFNAPVAVTLDTLQVAAELAGRAIAQVGYVAGRRSRASRLQLPWSALARPWDVVIVPGLGLENARAPQAALLTKAGQHLVGALARFHARGALLAASCTATFALAEAGLLDGRAATTSWWLAAEFRQRYPSVSLREGELTTEDGRVLCAGGSLAHIDLMLALLAKLYGNELATRSAQYLVSPERGPQSAVAQIGQTRISDPLVAAAITHVQRHLAEQVDVQALAKSLGTSQRTLHRRVHALLGLSVIGLVRRVRGEEAIRLLRETDLSLAVIAERVGYRDVATVRTLITAQAGQTPGAVRHQVRARV